MPRKRKVRAIVPDETEETDQREKTTDNSRLHHGPMYTIMSNVQLNETFHNKYIREMQQLYEKMDHDAFMFTFIKMLKSVMAAEETNEYANTALIFCAKYVSSYNGEDTHPVLLSTFKWLLSTISNNPHIRYRLCQFVNMMLNALGLEAALDDTICDNILGYMVNRLRDLNPNVRVQAILALQRLQVPDNPDDIIVKTYQFHLSSDPSPRVRQAVITSMGRNYNTIPYILERLWDVDEKVRRHTYLHMSSYPVKAYKVSQRLTFLEQGLNDRSDMVRKVVTTVMLPQWLESYNKNVISLISALKLDSNESEIHRFRKITKMALVEIFKRQKKDELIKMLPLEEEGGDYEKCVPFEKLTVEVTLYWFCLIEYLQNDNSDELDSIIPELTTFCNYVFKYCESSKSDMDKWQKMEYQYILLTFMEIVKTFDLGDEIGRDRLKQLLDNLLRNFEIEEHTIIVIIQCAENLITKQEERLQFFVDIVKHISESKSLTNELSHDRTLIEELLEKYPDKSLKYSLSALKVKILDLEEQEMNFVEKKDYVQAQRIAEERNACSEEYSNLLKPLFSEVSTSGSEASRKYLSISIQQSKKVTTEILIKSLQISYYMVVSKKVKSLTPIVCELYKDFIRRHIESNQIAVRDWALKCGTAYSMLYEPLSKDVYNELYSQFYKNHNIRLWKTAIECIFELLDRYGCSHFEVEDKQNKSRKAGRQLYNTLESIDVEEETSTSGIYGVDLIFMMSHFLDTCVDACILKALITGFCRLILHGRIKNDDIMEKLLLKYFNPITEPEINQILGVFFECLIKRKKQEYLQPCLIPTITTIMSAPYDSPLHEIKPETVLRFVIDSTRPICPSSGIKIHNMIALSFMQEMENNISNKELMKILAKMLVTLEVLLEEVSFRDELKGCCEKIAQCDIDSKTLKYITNFRDILDGTFNPNSASIRTTIREGTDDENAEDATDDEDENQNKIDSEHKEAEKDKIPNENSLDGTIEETIVEENEEDDEEEEEAHAPVNVNAPVTTVEKSLHLALESEKENEAEKENVENVVPTTTEQPPSPELQAPTTFGRDNTTNLRYLRKSMNVQHRSSEEESPKKVRLAKKSKPKTRTSGRAKKPGNTSRIQGCEPEYDKNTTQEKAKTAEEESDCELIALAVSSDDEIVSFSQSNSGHNSDAEVPPSPNALTAVRSRRLNIRATDRKERPQAQRKTRSKSVTAKKDNKSANELIPNEKPKRAIKRPTRLFSSPQIEKVSENKSNEMPRKETNANKTIVEPKKAVKNNGKKKSLQKTKIASPVPTKPREKPLKPSKIPTLKLNRNPSTSQGCQTRNTSKRNYLFNNVVTRRTLSAEKPSNSLARLLIASPTKRLSSNKENKQTGNDEAVKNSIASSMAQSNPRRKTLTAPGSSTAVTPRKTSLNSSMPSLPQSTRKSIPAETTLRPFVMATRSLRKRK